MAAEISALKGQLKLDPKLNAIAKDKKKDMGEDKGKKKNKKDTSNKKYQKKDEAWKKVPPKDGKERDGKQVGKFTFNWCNHHMAWMVHKPSNYTLGQKHKEDQKRGNNNKANSAVIASLATTTLNNCYVALLATLATMNDKE
jgi:hypothetical protein